MRTLRIGPLTIGLRGLTDPWAAVVDRRFGGFVERGAAPAPDVEVRIVPRAGERVLDPWAPGEAYRIEAERQGATLAVRSYHFALGREPGGPWQLAIEDTGREPVGRIIENALRYVLAHLAMERDGFAMHGAGVRRDGRAWVFAGPSRSGKTTAVSLSAPCESLGDDFAVVLPDGRGGWGVPAVPFDNAETAPRDPVRGLVPLAGIWRLIQSSGHAVDRPAPSIAQASLLACAAFPWAFPGMEDRLADAVGRVAEAGLFAHLRFARDPGFWPVLVRESAG